MRSEAQKRAQQNYQKKIRIDKKSQFNVEIKKSDFEKITNYCNLNKISKAQLLINMFNYCVVHNVDLHEQIEIPAESAELLKPGIIEGEKED